ncbi:MAG TPA: BTAD domain-containing putative transcriptional regulator [Actinomycetota bacterium]|nr:BTAD domain-containing putative transcriptional regulator [Actinomycetota bacterium]
MAKVEVELLGAPVARVDGRAIEVDTRKALALLAYLGLHDRPQSRDHVAGVLWPDYDQDRARAALRRTLSTLKAALGEGCLSADRSLLALRPDAIDIDVATFRAAVSRARSTDDPAVQAAELGTAVELYRGDFLEGFSLRDSDVFEEWQFRVAEELRRELTDSLDRLVDLLARDNRLDDAIDIGRRRLGLDELNEPTHRSLMELSARKGDRARAVRQYRDCVTVLDRELGVAPLAETTALYEAIIGGQVEPDPRPVTVPAPLAETSELPLAGRDEELALMLRNYSSTADRPTVVTIEGEAGIGKTRLIDEFVRRTEPHALRARGYQGETGVEYGVIAQAIEALAVPEEIAALPERTRTDLAHLVPGFATTPIAPSRDRITAARLFEAIRDLLTPGSQERRLVVIDDAQWSDSASLDVLGYVLRRTEEPLCLVIAWRSEEVHDDLRLKRLLKGADRGTHLHIVLDRLDERSVAEIVERRFPHDSEGPTLARRLTEETEGLPFFINEYLSLGAMQGTTELPRTIRDLLHGRLELASDIARQILGTAAVIDRSFDFETLHRASGRTELETVDAIDELLGVGCIRSIAETSDLFEFSHDKLRVVVLEDMSPIRRRVLHRRIADTISEAGNRNGSLDAVAASAARHYREAGDLRQAATLYRRAGEHAVQVFAHSEAVAHLEAALACGSDDSAYLLELLGDVHILMGDYSAARTRYETAVAAIEAGPAQARLERKLGGLHVRRGELGLARSHLDQALTLEPSPETRSEALVELALVGLRERDLDQAREHATSVTRQSDLPASIRARAENIAGMVASAAQDPDDALTHLETSLALAREADDDGVAIAALNNLALLARDRGDRAAAIELTQSALELCRRIGDRHREAALENNLADLLHAAGERDQAMAHLKAAAVIFAEVGDEPEGPLAEVWKLVDW